MSLNKRFDISIRKVLSVFLYQFNLSSEEIFLALKYEFRECVNYTNYVACLDIMLLL